MNTKLCLVLCIFSVLIPPYFAQRFDNNALDMQTSAINKKQVVNDCPSITVASPFFERALHTKVKSLKPSMIPSERINVFGLTEGTASQPWLKKYYNTSCLHR